MAETPGEITEPMKNICAIIQERDKIIRETDIRVEYYKNALEKVLDEIKAVEMTRKRISEEDLFLQEQNENFEIMKPSLQRSQEVAWQSLKNHQYLEQLVAKELESKEKNSQSVEQECRHLYSEAKKLLDQNPLYQELEKEKVEFLKLDIKRRDLEVKIKLRKRIIAQKNAIQKQIFYNFFIKMAEDYVLEQRTKEVEKLKAEELEAVKGLFAVQEQVKMKQKLGASRDNIKRMSHINFGPQEVLNVQNKVDAPQQKKEPKLFNEKLTKMFQQDETKTFVMPPQKVHILNQKVIMPAAPHFTIPEKRKATTIDLSRKWQKLIKNSSFSRNSINGCYASQESEKQLSQSSQQSQTEAPIIVSQHVNPIKNTDAMKPVMQTQEIQRKLITVKENVPSIQYQMIENMNVGADQLKIRPSQIMGETSRYEAYKYCKPPNENIETSKPITQSQDSQRVSSQVQEKEALIEQVVENTIESEQFTIENSHIPEQPLTATSNVFNSFNMTFMGQEGENSHMGVDFETSGGEMETHVRSPEFSYEMEQPFKAPEVPTFGGGFFSFGKNMFNPKNMFN